VGVDGRTVPVDTGFMVFNERTYPHFVRMLDALGVASRPSDMSFSVRCDRCDVEYSSAGLRGLFARPRQAFTTAHLAMLGDVLRFFRTGRAALADGSAAARSLAPRVAVVLGSGLARAVTGYAVHTECPFGDVPGMGSTSVHGHAGKVSIGSWGGPPAMVFHGRLHFYEGKTWDTVTGTVRLARDLGCDTLVLTNAAGGIHNELNPGDLMAITGHREWLHPRDLGRNADGPPSRQLFSNEWAERLVAFEASQGRKLLSGTYAALTGPCYETPAEIRALKATGADAVGMSTVKEAEAGCDLGMTVIGISCITNKAAGLSAGPLDHKEVLENAAAPAERVGRLIQFILA
jgi:purine-nucleoside phosphorylase